MDLPACGVTPGVRIEGGSTPSRNASSSDSTQFEEFPKGCVEETVAEIWRSLLCIDAIGRHDDFFRLGGNSMLAMAMIVQISGSFRISLPMLTTLGHPTIMELGRLIEAQLISDLNATPRETGPSFQGKL